MRNRIVTLLILAVSSLEATDKAVERCGAAARLLEEIMGAPDKSIPLGLFDRAHCVALIPGVKKVGFIFGGKYGKGVLLCRDKESKEWSGPSTVRIEGGSFGLQLGGSSTDVVLLVMNEEGVEKLQSSKFTLGADAAVAGGPVGRSVQAQTDAQMRAKILSYSRSRGLFAGVSLEGATLRPDNEANWRIYGEYVSPRQILAREVAPPETTKDLIATLKKYSAMAETARLSAKSDQRHGGQEASSRDKVRPGLLKITSEPTGADVELNSNFNGLTPRTKEVKAGEYEVKLRKRGFEEWVKTLTVEPGQTVIIHAELRQGAID